MSALAAVLGGVGAARGDVARALVGALAHRGAERAAWDLGDVALAHGARRAEERAERGGVRALLDGFLTNRSELAARLGLPVGAPDASLVVAAYERFGAGFPRELRGELSLLLWDGRTRTLHAVRDALGLRPLYWSRDPVGGLRLASEPQALFADGLRRHAPCRAQLGLAAVGLYTERDQTLLEGVRVVPPGHALVARAGEEPRVSRYRAFDLGRVTRHRDRRAYVEQFRAELERAVRSRLPAGRPAGAHVSGGLDSSSVAVVARAAAPVTFFHAAFRGLPCDERPWAREVARHARARLVEVDAPRPVVEPGEGWSRIDPTREPLRELLDEARAQGVDALLTGFGGDEALDWKGHEAAEALRTGQLRLAAAWTGLDRAPVAARAWGRLASYGLRPLLPPRLRGALRRLRRPRRFPLLAPDLEVLARAELDDRARRALATPAASPSARAMAGYYEGEGEHEITLRDVDRLAARAGVELRHPLYDVDLVDLVLSFPFDVRTAPGTSKVLLRAGLPDLLPAAVRVRTDKAEFTPYWAAAMAPLQADLPRLLERGRLVSYGVLRPEAAPGLARTPWQDAQEVVDVLSLELWLRHHDERGCDGFL